MADRRGSGVVNQRTFADDPPPTPPPEERSPPPPTPAPPPTEEARPTRRVYAPVVASSDALWERKLRWLKLRQRVEKARASEAPPETP